MFPSCLTGAELQRPLTSFNLLETGINPVGHMTTLQGTRKWLGLGKQGEKLLTNVFSMLQPFLPPPHRAVLSLSWMLYERLKVDPEQLRNKLHQQHISLFSFKVFLSL